MKKPKPIKVLVNPDGRLVYHKSLACQMIANHPFPSGGYNPYVEVVLTPKIERKFKRCPYCWAGGD